MREKGWEERGPKAHFKHSDFGSPYDLGTLSWPFKNACVCKWFAQRRRDDNKDKMCSV